MKFDACAGALLWWRSQSLLAEKMWPFSFYCIRQYFRNLEVISPIDCLTFKPAIHYSRTWRIGDEIIFSPNKILLAKMRQTCCCTLFVVCHQFLHGRWFFFLMKTYFVFVDEITTSTQILCTAYGEKPVRETWWTPYIHYSLYVVFSSFRPYFAVRE